MKSSSDPILILKQIASELGYSPDTVRRKFKQGKLPGAFQAGGKGSRIMMPLSAVRKLKGCG